MSYIIIFGIPKGNGTLGVKVNRLLKEIGAEKIKGSVWRSGNLRELTKIAIWVRNAGGVAHIVEDRVVF